jgi:hypothetical protein
MSLLITPCPGGVCSSGLYQRMMNASGPIIVEIILYAGQ